MSGKKHIYICISVLLWLLIWQLAASLININIILPTPLSVLKSLYTLVTTKNYYNVILSSFGRIFLGFIYGLFSGLILALIGCICDFFHTFTGVLIKVIQSIPVASFIIFCFYIVSAEYLSTAIAAITVTPIIYVNVISTISNTDKKILDFAKVYRLSFFKKAIYIYLPDINHALIPASRVAVGFAVKSGVAAEIIGIVSGSIGNELYKSKIYLLMSDMFAWTISLIVVSFIIEKITAFILKGVCALWEVK